MSLSLKVKSRSGRDLCTVALPLTATLKDLKAAFHKKSPKHSPSRQYFTIGLDKGRVALTPDTPLTSFGLKDGDVIYFKDLGPQISWRNVFLIEYFGPILIHSLFYWLPGLCYPSYSNEAAKLASNGHSYTQTVAYALVVLHYVKRELETLFVHRFSLDTMPIKNIFKNSFHYWIIGGLMIAYFLYHPLYTETKSHAFVTAGAVVMVAMELGNLYSHIILMKLRPKGSRARGIPRGFLFEYVTCANYTFELAAWLMFCLFTQTLTAYVFLLVSGAQIAQWSLKKHLALKKEFGSEAPKRKKLIPFVW